MAEFLLPYTDLLAEVAALALASALAALVLRGRVDRAGFARAAALTVALVVGAVGLGNLWSGLEEARGVRQGFTPPPGVAYRQKCLADQSQTYLAGYFEWLRGVLPPDAVYGGTGDTCYAFQLLPAVPARPRQQPTWTIYPGGLPPDKVREARRQRRLPADRRTVFEHARSGRGAVREEGGG